jgi:hypothetical protein
MGEDFLRKKQKGFKRRTDAAYKAHLERRDLFSAVQPSATTEVIGLLVPGITLTPGASLSEISEAVITPTRILLGCGNAKAVELDGEAAVQVRRAEKKFGGPLPKTVKETSPEGLVRILLDIPFAKPPDSSGGDS